MRASLLAGVLSGLLAQAKGGDDASYYPLGAGAQWIYSSHEGRYNTKVGEPGPMKDGPKRVIQCVADKDALALTSTDPSTPPSVRVLVTKDGVYQNSVDPANLILKFPLKKFDDWGPGDKKNGLPRFANHGQKELEVLGTKYLCWKITEQRSLPKGTRSWARWYAPGLGLVSEEYTEEIDALVTRRLTDLESFTRPARK